LLRPGERLDDLQYRGLHLIQDPKGYCFSADSVLLAGFFHANSRDRAVELCAGGGVIAALAGVRCNVGFVCVEKDAELADRARRSFAWNGLNFPVKQWDIQDAPALLGRNAFDVAVCNPPYFEGGTSSPHAQRSLARSGCSIEEVCTVAGALLKNGGKFFLCFPASRLAALMAALQANRLEVKKMQFVASKPEKAPYLVLVQANKNSKPGLVMEPVLYLTDHCGNETPQIRRIYHAAE